jgi:hypothetical protein
MKEIKEIIDMGRRLDELAYETYTIFSKREDFDKRLVAFWSEMAEWKKNHLKHWKKVSRTFVYKNLFNRSPEDLKVIMKQLKNIQSEHVEFMRRLRKKRISQEEAISQTILNEFCLITDIFLEIRFPADFLREDEKSRCIRASGGSPALLPSIFRCSTRRISVIPQTKKPEILFRRRRSFSNRPAVNKEKVAELRVS